MNKIKSTFAAMLLLAPAISGAAQEEADKVRTTTAKELNFQNQWFNTSNAAGQALAPLLIYHDFNAGYGIKSGEFRSYWDGQSDQTVHLSTSGNANLKGLLVQGDFSYDNRVSDGSLYNCILFQPSWDMPYYAADWNASQWKRQTFDMGFRMSSPLMAGDHLAVGGTMRYVNKVGGKQVDPRVENYVYEIDLAPSLVYSINPSHALGLSLSYMHGFERANPSTENYRVNQNVALMSGLGFFAAATVGGNTGLDIFYYKTNKASAALQYRYAGDALDLMLEATGGFGRVQVNENPTAPRDRGKTAKVFAELNAQMDMGESRNHRLVVMASYDNTVGTEVTQKINMDTKKWETIIETEMMSSMQLEASACYDWYLGKTACSYSWRIGADARFRMLAQDYYAPQSNFDAASVSLDISADKNIGMASGRYFLLISLHGGARVAPMEGEYAYNGNKNQTHKVVADFYPNELSYLTANLLNAGASIDFNVNALKKVNPYLRIEADYIKPFALDKSRICAGVTAGLLF